MELLRQFSEFYNSIPIDQMNRIWAYTGIGFGILFATYMLIGSNIGNKTSSAFWQIIILIAEFCLIVFVQPSFGWGLLATIYALFLIRALEACKKIPPR